MLVDVCTDPCFLGDPAWPQSSRSQEHQTCAKRWMLALASKACVGLKLMSMADFCPHRAQHWTRSGWGHWGSQASV